MSRSGQDRRRGRRIPLSLPAAIATCPVGISKTRVAGFLGAEFRARETRPGERRVLTFPDSLYPRWVLASTMGRMSRCTENFKAPGLLGAAVPSPETDSD